MQIASDVRLRIEALLTPQQFTALKDIVLGPWAVGLLAVPEVQAEIGLTEQQKTALKRIDQEAREEQGHFDREVFGILTPAQQERLRAEVDRRGW